MHIMGSSAEEARAGLTGHVSTVQMLTLHRELLVSQVKSTQCILDNLLQSGFLCIEDTEIIQRSATKTDQVIYHRSVSERIHVHLDNTHYPSQRHALAFTNSLLGPN